MKEKWIKQSIRLIILLIWLNCGCVPVIETPIETVIQPKSTATITTTATPTIIWFPATATPTRLPTQPPVPTPERKPTLGRTILEDDFSDKSLWQTSRDETGSVAYGKNELTIAIAKPEGVLSSLSEVELPDRHYLEINVNPSLCRGEDSFGILIRVTDPQVYYRLSINCMGQIKFDLIRKGTATALTDWIPSGQVLPGPMLELKLGVWSGETALAIYINDVHQFTISHPGLKNGNIGVFARSKGENALTVNFSELVVYQINTEPAIPQPTVTPTRRPTKTPFVR